MTCVKSCQVVYESTRVIIRKEKGERRRQELRRLRRLGIDPVPASRDEVLRQTTPFSWRALISMFCLQQPTRYSPVSSFFHDFSGTSLSASEQSLLGLGLNYRLPPSSAFNTDTIFGWKEDFTRFSRDVYRHDFFACAGTTEHCAVVVHKALLERPSAHTLTHALGP